MDRIASVLPSVLNRRGLQGQAKASLVVHLAQEWIVRTLPQFAADLSAKRLADGSLTIASRHSIAAQECQQLVPMLIEYLVNECGHKDVERVQVVRA